MKKYIYGAEMFDGVEIYSEEKIVKMIENFIELGIQPEISIIPALNDLIRYRKYQIADGQNVLPFRNAIFQNYETDSNEDRLWDCFERALRATNF